MRLKLYDFDSTGASILVRQGKGKKDRYVPIGERAAAWLEKYIREAPPAARLRAGRLHGVPHRRRASRSAAII